VIEQESLGPLRVALAGWERMQRGYRLESERLTICPVGAGTNRQRLRVRYTMLTR
jgi:hypothetical protein